jgi:chromosomal replication initiation ATPase DnaA
MKGDERILGEGDFVEAVLRAAQEKLDRKYHLRSRGYSFERLIKRVAKLFEMSPKELLSGGKHAKTVKARSVVCYWGNRELGMSTIELSKKLNISQPTASQSVVRGQKIARAEKLAFLE